MQISRPTLLLNESIARRNIERMGAKAKASGVTFRPHFKTHFSADIGSWYRDYGVSQCTVSSIEMAKYFSDNGWEDITIAFPVNRLEIDLINEINNRINLQVIIQDENTLEYIESNATSKLNYFIKVDIGTHRTGLSPAYDYSQLIKNTEKVNFKGFLCHAGHTYGSKNHDEIKQIYEKSCRLLDELRHKYLIENQIISYGDTPSCSVVEKFDSMDEIRPGNFLFYDWMQYNITSCNFEDIAVCMACPVVAKHPERQEIVVHGGAVHFSKDSISYNDSTVFGLMVSIGENGWTRLDEDIFLTRLSQEHGILSIGNQKVFNSIQVGDVIGILPIHSCLTANLMGSYLTLEGKRISQMQKNVMI